MAQHCLITQFDEKKEITQKAILSFTAVWLPRETLSQHWPIMLQTSALLVDYNKNCCRVTKDNSSVQEEGFPATHIWLISNKMQICWFQKVHQAFHWFVPNGCQLAIASNCCRPPPAVQNVCKISAKNCRWPEMGHLDKTPTAFCSLLLSISTVYKIS